MKFETLAALALAAALAACAGGGSRDVRDERQPIRALLSSDTLVFASFDADNDVRVTAAEVEAGITREFARADANHDESLQPIEFQTWSNLALGGDQTGPYRLDFDRNVDNTITGEEFRAELRARAHDYDEDEDTVLSRSEFIRLVGQARPPRGPGQGSPQGGGGRPPQ